MRRHRLALIIFAAAALAPAVFFALAPVRPPDPLHALKQAYRRPPQIPFPDDNPYREESYQLGKLLFFDPRLSRSGVTACATCHNPSLGWTDGLALGVGDRHQRLARRVPTILNVAFGRSFFWDGRAATLEEQALGPIQSPAEMNLPLPELVERLSADSTYVRFFRRAFPDEPISPRTIGKALATFERTVVSGISPFDRWVAGDESAISPSARRGFAMFNGKAGCVRCHTGWNFTNGTFADTGVTSQDRGRGAVVGDEVVDFSFKTPTLRNVAQRGPYMHDGSLATLAEVIEHYDAGGRVARPTVRVFLRPLGLSDDEKRDLLSFLETLSSDDGPVILPLLPRGNKEEQPWRNLSSTH